MNNISLTIDIVIAAVILTGIIIGAARGFVKTVFGFFHGIASAIAAYLLTPMVTGFVKGTSFYTGLVEKTKNSLYTSLKDLLESDPEKLLSATDEINALIERFGSSAEYIKTEYERLVSEKITDAALSLTEYVVAPACSVLLTVLTFLLLFAVAFFLIYLIMKIFDGLSKLPVLKGFNRLFGGISGGIIGCVTVFLIITVFEAVLPFVAGTENTLTVTAIANSSCLYGIFTAINPLGLIFALIS